MNGGIVDHRRLSLAVNEPPLAPVTMFGLLEKQTMILMEIRRFSGERLPRVKTARATTTM